MTFEEKKKLFEELHVSVIHAGINFDSRDEACEAADRFSALLGQDKREVPGMSFFVGSGLELLNSRFRGRLGHVAYATDDLEKTLKVLEEEGYHVDWETARKNPDGSYRLVYLLDDFYGFRVHFNQR